MRRRLLPSLGELVAFESAGRHGGFTRAAIELNLSQGAVSRQIRLLEERIGAALFARVRQRVVLTAAGRIYLGEVQAILERLSDATHRVMSQAGAEAILNIAALPTFGARWLTPRLGDFALRHPRITVNIASRLAPFDFAVEPFDAAIHFGAPVWPNAVVYPLWDEEVIPVCSPAFREARGIGAPADLLTAPLLHQATRPTAWLDWFELVGVPTPHGARGPTYDQFSLVVQGAIAGVGAALAPRFLIETELASGRLVALSERSLRTQGGYYVVAPEARAADPAVQAFLAWLLETARAGPPETGKR